MGAFLTGLIQAMQDNPTQVPLWRQLQGAASLLMAVRDCQSMTAALEDVDAALRPGVQALGFHALRWLGRAEALRQQLAKRPPPSEADALLCVALACMITTPGTEVSSRSFGGAGFPEGSPPEHSAPATLLASLYTPYTLVDQAVESHVEQAVETRDVGGSATGNGDDEHGETPVR